MKAAVPLRVVWLFTPEDESLARELLRLAAVLERQQVIDNWSVLDLHPGQALEPVFAERVENADVVLVLSSPALVTWELQNWRAALSGRAPIIPVVLRAGGPSELDRWDALPKGRMPLLARVDRDEAMLEVVQALLEMVSLRSDEPASSIVGETTAIRGTSINEIFCRGVPQPTFTFVPSSNFYLIKHELSTMGTGLIVQGPSRTGKTTAVREALKALRVQDSACTWLHGEDPESLASLESALDALLKARSDRWLIIDDFHRLQQPDRLRTLASRMKVLADRPRSERHGKVTLIGRNPLGDSLLAAMPDLAGRFRVLAPDADSNGNQGSRIAQLVTQGEQAANIRFLRKSEFIRAASGNFALAQLLCNRAAVLSGVTEAQQELVEILLGPKDVIPDILDELSARFRTPLIDFAAFDRQQDPHGAALSLLWLLSRSTKGFVSLKEARLRFPDFGPTFDWFLASNMSAFFAGHPRLRELLYFRRDAGTLTMEDPQLKFYLRELDWVGFAEEAGLGSATFHPVDGPVWAKATIVTPVSTGVSVTTGKARVLVGTHVLHLSDLHIESNDQATEWYSQLAADLRQQGIERLDGVVVSGDVVQLATPTEYDAAASFLEKLMEGFSVRASSMAIVPGNHDVSWSASRSAYQLRRKADLSSPPALGTFVSHGEEVLEVRDDEAWPRRFEAFASFYHRITGDTYPLDFADQGTVVTLTTDRVIRFVGLNSAWESDHLFSGRASIHALALTRALDKLPTPKPSEVRIAVFHHPLQSGGDDRIRDDAFLQRRAIQGFRVVLHGHVHRADSALYRYDQSLDGRKLEVVTAGTFGAPTREWVPGYPLQYNLLAFEPNQLRVETRCRREVHGAWEPDARWRTGRGTDPVPRYFIEL